MFRMPSEETYLLDSFNKEDLFGKRKGITNSPHIKSQTDLDSNLVWAIAALMFGMLIYDIKPAAQMKTLRTNYRQSDMGKFEEADFKWETHYLSICIID